MEELSEEEFLVRSCGHQSIFHLSDVQWLSGDDDFNQNQFGNVHISSHSKPHVLQLINWICLPSQILRVLKLKLCDLHSGHRCLSFCILLLVLFLLNLSSDVATSLLFCLVVLSATSDVSGSSENKMSTSNTLENEIAPVMLK